MLLCALIPWNLIPFAAQVAVAFTLAALVACFFVVLAPVLRPQVLRMGMLALYGTLAATTGLLLIITS